MFIEKIANFFYITYKSSLHLERMNESVLWIRALMINDFRRFSIVYTTFFITL